MLHEKKIEKEKKMTEKIPTDLLSTPILILRNLMNPIVDIVDLY